VQTEAANNQQTSNSTGSNEAQAADPSRREPAKAKKYPVIQKTKDAERVAGFCDMSDEFNHDIKALQANDPLTFLILRQDVVKDMKNPKARQSYIEIQKEVEQVKRANAKEVRTVYAAKKPTGGIHVTAAVGGCVQLSSLLKGAGDEPVIDIEGLRSKASSYQKLSTNTHGKRKCTY
jgi:hypothetical protein